VLIVQVRVPSADALKSIVAIVRGDVVSAKREGEDFVARLVVHDEAEEEKLRASGVSLEILSDSRTRPDPRDQVSRVNRYAADVERWKRGEGGTGKGPGGGDGEPR